MTAPSDFNSLGDTSVEAADDGTVEGHWVMMRRWAAVLVVGGLAVALGGAALVELSERYGPSLHELLPLVVVSVVLGACSYGLVRRRPWARWLGLGVGIAGLLLADLREAVRWGNLYSSETYLVVGTALTLLLALTGRSMRAAFEGVCPRCSLIAGPGLRPQVLRSAIVLNIAFVCVWLVAGHGEMVSGLALGGASLALVAAVTAGLVLAMQQKTAGFGLLAITAPSSLGLIVILRQTPFLCSWWGSLHTAALLSATASVAAAGVLVIPAVRALRREGRIGRSSTSKMGTLGVVAACLLGGLSFLVTVAVVVPVGVSWSRYQRELKPDEGEVYLLSEEQQGRFYENRLRFYDMGEREVRAALERAAFDAEVSALVEEEAVLSLASSRHKVEARRLLSELLASSRYREIPRRVQLAELLREAGDLRGAEQQARRALELGRGMPTVSLNRARALLSEIAEAQDRPGEAFEQLAQSALWADCGCGLGHRIGARTDRLVRLFWASLV